MVNILGASLGAQLVKNLPAVQETWVWSLGWEDPLENPHGQRSLEGYSPWGRKESDTTERLNWTELNWAMSTCPLAPKSKFLKDRHATTNSFVTEYLSWKMLKEEKLNSKLSGFSRLARTDYVHLFPIQSSVTSCWQLEICYGWFIYATETSRCYKLCPIFTMRAACWVFISTVLLPGIALRVMGRSGGGNII